MELAGESHEMDLIAHWLDLESLNWYRHCDSVSVRRHSAIHFHGAHLLMTLEIMKCLK